MGNPNNNTKSSYDSSGENWHGPRTAIEQLPTTSQWNNVSLKNISRTILNENSSNITTGGTLPNKFSYEGYSSRLITIQEVRKAAHNDNIPIWKVGELDDYNYFVENTSFSSPNGRNLAYWLETPCSDSSSFAFGVYGHNRNVGSNDVPHLGVYSVRPAIEVSKTNIEY